MKKEKPDFSKCIRDENGDLWCFDETTKLICRVIPVEHTTIPNKVLYELLQVTNA